MKTNKVENNTAEPTNGHPFNRPEQRALTAAERSLLEWLLANGVPDAQQYAPQLADVRVVGACTCGCPTIDLAIGNSEQRTIGASHVLAEFEGVTLEGVPVVVILHARQGNLSELEIFDITETEGSFGLPTIESLRKS
jgi:hypothetical protein